MSLFFFDGVDGRGDAENEPWRWRGKARVNFMSAWKSLSLLEGKVDCRRGAAVRGVTGSGTTAGT